jgi:hypothetical protein
MTMTDEQLAGLFAEGTAPESDAAFVRRVDARIGRARLGARLLPLAMRALVLLTLAAAAFITASTLDQIAVDMPEFMGVPVPLILMMLAAGFALRSGRFMRLRFGW